MSEKAWPCRRSVYARSELGSGRPIGSRRCVIDSRRVASLTVTPSSPTMEHNGLLLSTVQLLSAYGASRAFVVDGTERTAEDVAAHFGFEAIREWLAGSRQWTMPLHHLATVGADRARALLRGGADLRAAAAGADAPTPLSLAERLRAEGSAPAGSAADLVLRAAEPWSPQTHHLFPSEARARAVEAMLLGEQLSREARFEREDDPGAGLALWDVWLPFVVPHAVERGSGEALREARFTGRRPPLALVGLEEYLGS